MPILVIAGPTAVGKTAVSLDLAERSNAEIISADSRQVYRHLDIGTAKPSVDERRGIPHHFIDEREPGEPFSAGMFASEAEARIEAIHERGKTPVVVGGSTLYLHALMYGLADIPDVPNAIRLHIEERLAEEGAGALYTELQHLDPAAAATLDPTKTQRLVRALEVYYGTGQPLSSHYDVHPPPRFTYRLWVLTRDRVELYTRINRRVDHMLEAGLVDEVRGVLARGVDPSENALRTIGYREVIDYLQGHISQGEMVRLIKRNSRRYAKRQLTWFRRYGEAQWVDAGSEEGLPTLENDLF